MAGQEVSVGQVIFEVEEAGRTDRALQKHEEGLSSAGETGKSVLVEVPAVAPDTLCDRVYELFVSKTDLHSLPIVETGRPRGLINRYTLIDRFSQRFFRELYGRKPISLFMEKNPLVVDQAMGLDDLSGILAEEGDRAMADGFIITEGGIYRGMGTGHRLMRELTRRRQVRLHHLAHHDTLTGLPNRLLFYDRLKQQLGRAARSGDCVALLFIDLDRFKWVNDNLGHPAGDQLLVGVADRLAGCIRESDTLARLGGDEFTVILPGLREPKDAALVAEKVTRALTEPFELAAGRAEISCSIGISVFPGDGAEAEILVKKADNALYKAKENRGRTEFFTAALNEGLQKRQDLEAELRRALQNGEFTLHYQPQVELGSARLRGAEALIRWNHPSRGLVSPADFIPFAEESGFISQIGQWVVTEACRQAKAWQEAGHSPLRVAVNVSPQQFKDPKFPSVVFSALEKSGLEPGLLELEITEGIAMKNGPEVLEMLKLLRARGVSLFMDDFGTGYSSLSYLHRFSLDGLKIDRSLVSAIEGEGASGQAIAGAILAMARSLGLRVVAEGVETQSQLQFLAWKNCDFIQGYLASPALDAEKFEGLLVCQSEGMSLLG
jgi:diguanylate cyclase (GGDEF)-like protein